jgi:hypothetical protein
MDRRSERRDDRNRNDSCEDRQSHIRSPSVAPVEIVVHGYTFPNVNQRGCLEPVPLLAPREARDPEPATSASIVVEERS